MQAPAIKTDRRYTYADYLQFPDDQRWEIIDGVAYDISPSPSVAHQDLSMELSVQVGAQLRGRPCRVIAAPIDVRFENTDKTDKVVQPDLLVVCDPGKITSRGVVGAPDWIVEILSPATAGKDQIVKRALYEAQGVREFWLVHPVDRLVTIYRLGADGAYGASDIAELKGKTSVRALDGVEIDWDLWQPLEGQDPTD